MGCSGCPAGGKIKRRTPDEQELEPHILERAEHPISRRDIDPDVLKVLYRLIKAGHIAYLVGGSVRDLMLGRRPKDFDVATDAHPQQVRDLFRNSRMIGRRFRLVHVFFGPKNLEVATFRRRSEDGSIEDPLIRHDNTFGTPEEDAFRRDFTVNALFYDPQTFRVIDYCGGVPDLKSRLIRTIGDPELRMREDPVRMMRAVRFAAKLGFEIESATRAAIEQHRADLLKSSVPRLVEETYRTIGQSGAARALLLMEQLGLLEQLMPWLSTHLKSEARPLEDSRTIRNLAALGKAVAGGLAPNHQTILAAMFLDQQQAPAAPPNGVHGRFDLLAELRHRGFARGDTEAMRLILDAQQHLANPTRRTRRLINRPYFEDARIVFELTAPNYQVDHSKLSSFLHDPESYLGGRPAPPSAGQPGRRRRRRRRRGGRRWQEHRVAAQKTAIEAPAPAANGAPATASEHVRNADSPPHEHAPGGNRQPE